MDVPVNALVQQKALRRAQRDAQLGGDDGDRLVKLNHFVDKCPPYLVWDRHGGRSKGGQGVKRGTGGQRRDGGSKGMGDARGNRG